MRSLNDKREDYGVEYGKKCINLVLAMEKRVFEVKAIVGRDNHGTMQVI